MSEHAVHKPSGTIIITDLMGGVTTADTLQCVHCGKHWMVKPGSGRVRGYCFRCGGPICGPCCVECVPYERQIEMLEERRP